MCLKERYEILFIFYFFNTYMCVCVYIGVQSVFGKRCTSITNRYKGLDETGLVGVVCRHEFPLKFLSIRHGER